MTASSTERMRVWRARQIAAGRRIVRGKVVDGPRVQRRAGEEPPHGTQARYRWIADPCRCARCTEANTVAARLYRQGRSSSGVRVR